MILIFTSGDKMVLRIAIPATSSSIDSNIAEHFGRAPFYIIVDIENFEIKKYDVLENTSANSHAPGEIPRMLASKKINILLCKRIGYRALSYFEQFGIHVIKTDLDGVKEALMKFIEELKTKK
ncbi:MAG: dinitrogenase iron-molybdenum cofactor biosynthesis protein [Candidatus Hecatellales archaeon]|nr:MAG: dinitrogenase iron-molybdenum cofactor biosynthesis protein [Candidatus Hecatellales archaeon]